MAMAPEYFAVVKTVSIEEFFSDSGGRVLFDVRTPAEFEKGHVPGAMNLPLFSNLERAEVGTLYKNTGKEAAYLKGLEFAGEKLAGAVARVLDIAPQKKVAVHCWRGGQRSASVAALLRFSGFDVQVLTGGYKAYRNFVLDSFSTQKLPLVILGGKTGSGKTETLHVLRELGEQVIDLEGMARHKGSAFGALGESPQPTTEQFENDLFAAVGGLNPERRIWVENESRNVGRNFIPQGFWDQMRSTVLVNVEMPFDLRVKRLIEDYAQYPPDEIEASLLKIERRMGGQYVKAALEAYRNGDLQTSTGIALKYYDKTYVHATSKGQFCQVYSISTDTADARKIANKILDFANENGL
jgi:tRNA 2-selenouridine synthase